VFAAFARKRPTDPAEYPATNSDAAVVTQPGHSGIRPGRVFGGRRFLILPVQMAPVAF
jgi:hypothetical protein